MVPGPEAEEDPPDSVVDAELVFVVGVAEVESVARMELLEVVPANAVPGMHWE